MFFGIVLALSSISLLNDFPGITDEVVTNYKINKFQNYEKNKAHIGSIKYSCRRIIRIQCDYKRFSKRYS